MAFVIPDPMKHRGKSYPHTGDLAILGTQCAAFVQKVFDGNNYPGPAIGQTKHWKPGAKVWPPSGGQQTLEINQTFLPHTIADVMRNNSSSTGNQCLQPAGTNAILVKPGTVVATFENRRYPDSRQHVAVFLNYIPNGFRVLDQYFTKQTVDFASIDNHDNGPYDPRRYFVVEIS